MTDTSVSALHNPPPFHSLPTLTQFSPSFDTRSPPTVLCESPALASKLKNPAGRLGVRLGLSCNGLRRYSEAAQSVPDCYEVSARQVHPGWRRSEQEEVEWSPSNLFHPSLAFLTSRNRVQPLDSAGLQLSLIPSLGPTHLFP